MSVVRKMLFGLNKFQFKFFKVYEEQLTISVLGGDFSVFLFYLFFGLAQFAAVLLFPLST